MPSNNSGHFRDRLAVGISACMILTMVVLMMFGLSIPVSGTKGGVQSFTLYAGTDIEMKIDFLWEIDHDVWLSNNTYEIRLTWNGQYVGGNYFTGTYLYTVTIPGLIPEDMVAGGEGGYLDGSLTNPVFLKSLESEFVADTFVRLNLTLDSPTHGRESIEHDLIPITVVGTAPLTQTVTATITTIDTVTQIDTILQNITVHETVTETTYVLSGTTTTAIDGSWILLLTGVLAVWRLRKG